MGMSRSGWNRLTSRPAECLSLTIDWRNDLCLVGAQVVPRYFCSDAPRVFGVGQASRRVMADGFSWNGQTYDSLSKVAFAITGTKWSGPRFFCRRGKESRLGKPKKSLIHSN